MSRKTHHSLKSSSKTSSKDKKKTPRNADGGYYEFRQESYSTLSSTDPGLGDDQAAYEEVQQYADFQRDFSERVSQDATYNPGSTSWSDTRAPAGYASNSGRGPLHKPVLIPQEDGRSGWIRAYTSSLQDAGVNQPDFLNFLDILNRSCSILTYLDVINLAALDSRSAAALVDTAVLYAKSSAMEKPQLIHQANTTFFASRGLYMTLVTYHSPSRSTVLLMPLPYQPPSRSSTYTTPTNQLVDILQPASLTLLSTSSAYQGSSSSQVGYGSQGYLDLRGCAAVI
ncbi:hypothetical protein HYALB_00004750 [Hymenoscyphus albidus]|uniref:Uncharacterized protein n=1 Tax=Hymenoscyphus albidus TaxID=595503 RepID=A0A9N9LY06_9HELO|nr:hypothetical protein HYALB_00004750 [Hymenoscyphus albidus]